MKIRLAGSFLCFVALLSPSLSLRAAEFSSADGVVEVKKSGAALWMRARPKTAVGTGDVIRTGAGAKAEVRLDEGHRVSLKEKTTARVESAEKGDSRFFLEVGKLKARVAKLHAGSKFEVRTPLAVASVRGTVFEVDVAEDHSSSLFVEEGKVGYKELGGIGHEEMVPAGQSFTYSPPAHPGSDGGNGGGQKPKDSDEEKKKKEGDGKGGGDEVVPPPKADLTRDDFKREVLRETQFSLDKEVVQSDVAQDLKQEQVQSGRALVDHLGRRVRYEEYLSRPTESSYSQLAISQREGRTDTTRYDVYARFPLPKDLREVELFHSKDGEKLENYAVGTELFTTNGDTYYREWRDGGKPVQFYASDQSSRWQQVAFADWFVEMKGEKDAPVLLSHWVPDPNFLLGNPDATADRDRLDVYGADLSGFGLAGIGDGGQDIPTGYVDLDVNGKNNVGDDRPIDNTGWSAADRQLYFTNSKVRDVYRASEGYPRTVEALFDDKSMSGAFRGTYEADRRLELDKIRDESGKQSLFSVYFDPSGNKAAVVQVDSYYVSDDGFIYPYGKIGDSIAGFTGINRELVYTSSLDKRDIDVIVGPSMPSPSGKEDVPSYIRGR